MLRMHATHRHTTTPWRLSIDPKQDVFEKKCSFELWDSLVHMLFGMCLVYERAIHTFRWCCSRWFTNDHFWYTLVGGPFSLYLISISRWLKSPSEIEGFADSTVKMYRYAIRPNLQTKPQRKEILVPNPICSTRVILIRKIWILMAGCSGCFMEFDQVKIKSSSFLT